MGTFSTRSDGNQIFAELFSVELLSPELAEPGGSWSEVSVARA